MSGRRSHSDSLNNLSTLSPGDLVYLVVEPLSGSSDKNCSVVPLNQTSDFRLLVTELPHEKSHLNSVVLLYFNENFYFTTTFTYLKNRYNIVGMNLLIF